MMQIAANEDNEDNVTMSDATPALIRDSTTHSNVLIDVVKDFQGCWTKSLLIY